MAESTADQVLSKAGLFLDDLNRIRLLSPELADTCAEVVTESKQFSGQISQFRDVTKSLIDSMEELASMVEAEKLRAMAVRNALKTADRMKAADSAQKQILIREKQIELERLTIELEASQKMEQEQKEYLQQFINS